MVSEKKRGPIAEGRGEVKLGGSWAVSQREIGQPLAFARNSQPKRPGRWQPREQETGPGPFPPDGMVLVNVESFAGKPTHGGVQQFSFLGHCPAVH